MTFTNVLKNRNNNSKNSRSLRDRNNRSKEQPCTALLRSPKSSWLSRSLSKAETLRTPWVRTGGSIRSCTTATATLCNKYSPPRHNDESHSPQPRRHQSTGLLLYEIRCKIRIF